MQKLTHQKITTEVMFVCHSLTTSFKVLTFALIYMYGKTILLMMGLVPAVVADKEDVTIDDAVKMYADDLPSRINVEEEFMRWKRRWRPTEKRLRPSFIAQALKECDSDMYPNLSVLLKIAGTFPATSCECERSGSVLKRLNTYLSASVGQEHSPLQRLTPVTAFCLYRSFWCSTHLWLLVAKI